MKNIFGWILLMTLVSCNSKIDKQAVVEKQPLIETTVTLNEAQLKNAALTIANPVDKVISTTIKVNGQVDVPPQSLVSISFPLGGYLKSSHLLPGTSVRKGEVIAVMEDQSYVQLQQDYLMAKAKMEYLSADLQRQKELSDADAVSKKNYQQVLSDFKMQQVIIKALEEKLRIINIDPEKLTVNKISRIVNVRSPISGYVTTINVNIGKYVNPSDVLFELVNPNDIHAAMTVFEKDISLFKKGMKGKVALNDNPSKEYLVDVILATKNVDESRSGLVHCHFENHNIHELLPGMFLTGVFELGNKPVIAVPEDAVVRFEGKQYLFIAKNKNTFELRLIETAGKENGWIAIKPQQNMDWLKQKIVVKNAYSLLGMLKNKMEEE
jgi:cobalt-zinc-cadmium efflux system membrane fusion protein